MKFSRHSVRQETVSTVVIRHFTEVPDDDIEAIRDATIITVIEMEDDDMSISTSVADDLDQTNIVNFMFGKTVNVTNPLNGETVKVVIDPSSSS